MNSNEDMEKRTTGQEKTDKDVLVKPIEDESTSSENEKENCHNQADAITQNITEKKQKSKKRMWSLIIAIFGCSVCIATFSYCSLQYDIKMRFQLMSREIMQRHLKYL